MKYWVVKYNTPDWLYIYAPIMEKETSFKIKRQLVMEFKEIENIIKTSKAKGWIGYAKLTDPHIMKMYGKVGAQPYKIDKEFLWFKKEI